MKSGMNPTQFLEEIEAQANAKVDYAVPARKMQFAIVDNKPTLVLGDGQYQWTPVFQEQTAGYLDFPRQFFDRSLATFPEETAALANKMLSTHTHDTRMIRTWNRDGRQVARANLSNAYRTMDNDALAVFILELIRKSGEEWSMADAMITDTRMYLKVMTPYIKATKVGDKVQRGLIIQNSETGDSALSIKALDLVLKCTNGMVGDSGKFRAIHLGARYGDNDEITKLLADDTRAAQTRYTLLEARDVIRHIASPAGLDNTIARIDGAQADKIISDDLPKVVEKVGIKFGLSEGEQKSALRKLIEGASSDGLTRWGITQAVTALPAVMDMSYERAVELEELGGKIVTLPPSEWKTISEAKN